MTAPAAASHTARAIQVAGLNVHLLEGGSGEPAVVLHHSTGNPGWIPFYEELAGKFSLTVPDMPGYGQSTRPEWAREPRDLAILLNQALDQLGLTSGVSLVGLGLGGFIAAEMATMNQARLRSLTLIGAAGIQPDQGEILDQMMIDFEEYMKAGFRSDAGYAEVFGQQAEASVKELWDFSREMTARITWKPYMFNRRLPHLLKEVRTPTLLIWGSRDVVVPLSAAERYKSSLPNARLEVIDGAGHLVEYEEPARIAGLIASHVAQSA